MKILVTEDDAGKLSEISDYLKSIGVDGSDIISATDMAEFMAAFDDTISICIVDLRLPAYNGAQPDTNGIGILQAIEARGAGRVKMLGISSYPEEFEAIRASFEGRGCMLVAFGDKDVWQNALRLMVVQSKHLEGFDFVIFSALRSERAPYTGISSLNGRPAVRDGFTRYDIEIAGRKGTVIELPRMGLVDASVTASACIERFKPKLVAMSGICAGFPERAELGQLLVSEMSYEYQSGKWSTDGFSQEPYQVPISEHVRLIVRELIEDTSILPRLETGWSSGRPSEMSPPKLAAFTSGSAVIASEEYIAQVATYHRRVAGLDMEIHGLQRAAQLSQCKPEVICAKTVVDLAGSEKNDKLHPYGCYISAKFIVEFIEKFFA